MRQWVSIFIKTWTWCLGYVHHIYIYIYCVWSSLYIVWIKVVRTLRGFLLETREELAEVILGPGRSASGLRCMSRRSLPLLSVLFRIGELLSPWTRCCSNSAFQWQHQLILLAKKALYICCHRWGPYHRSRAGHSIIDREYPPMVLDIYVSTWWSYICWACTHDQQSRAKIEDGYIYIYICDVLSLAWIKS